MNERLSRTAILCWLALSIAGLAVGCAPIAAESSTGAEPVSDWDEIASLIEDQRYEAAAGRVAEQRARALAAGDDGEWTRALIQEVQLRTALGGFEKAVALLLETEWPESPRLRSILDLFYAQGLIEYAGAYSWEVRQRERVGGAGGLDLSAWTIDQIVEEAHRSFAEVWARRQEFGSEPLGDLELFVERNDYPERIRGTLRDSVSYLWVEFLADSRYWSPEQSNRLHRLDLDALVSASGDQSAAADPLAHPLARIAALLGDLEAWHRENGRLEAALEARLERLRKLHAHFSAERDRQRIRAALESELEEFDRTLPWWSVGQALLAELVRDQDRPDSLIRARKIAAAGLMAHRDSIGGRRAAHLIASIESPSFFMESMATDAPGRRSLRLTHKNLPRLYFRAYRIDMKTRLLRTRDRDLLPGYQDVEGLLKTSTPEVTWTVELPPTPDFRTHVTYVTPPIETPGTYVVVATANEKSPAAARLYSAIPLVISDLVIVRREVPSSVEVTVRSGATGKPVPKVNVSLFQRDYRRGHQLVTRQMTDVNGRVPFRLTGQRGGYFVVVETDDEIVVDDGYINNARAPVPQRKETAGLLYTDRSIYRPGQEVLWKLIAYQGDSRAGSFETLPATELEVELLDGNGQVVESASVETNAFGSASGSFVIPPGRRLGQWLLRSPIGAGTGIQVEEYKRPGFEVSILDPTEQLRLNRPARLGGEARYYFGLPVTAGAVDWRVEREPVYPWWWSWRPDPGGERETIAAGTTQLGVDGKFEIEFVPEADERQGADAAVTYRYRLSADVTDEGGETRSDTRVFRLGFVAVEATIRSDLGFLTAGEPASIEVSRLDLDGRPAPGEGRWRLLAVVQPTEAQLPADQPVPGGNAGDESFATPGDSLRARWEPALALPALLREWPDGPEVRSGRLVHGDDGVARLDLGTLEAGVYRLRYSTEDGFGALYETRSELLVAGEETNRLAAPAVLISERNSVPVGGAARLFVHSGLEDQELLFEVFRDGRRTELRRLNSSDGPHIVEIPIGDGLRGGFGVRLTALRDHQLMTFTESIFVPWDDRKLTVEFESFRDLLRPGQRERWTVKLRAADGEALGKGSAELLAYMYDRSLDLFAQHNPVDPITRYPYLIGGWPIASTLGSRHPIWMQSADFREVPDYPWLRPDRLEFFDSYPIGGPGRRQLLMRMEFAAPMPAATKMADAQGGAPEIDEQMQGQTVESFEEPAGEPPAGEAPREDFSETAFWEPHLGLDDDGTVAFEFTVPDSLTDWSVWVHALTRDLKSGSIQRTTRTAKELMVRPYLPRFLRVGDEAELKVVVNNAGEVEMSGGVDFDIVDPATGESVRADFGLTAAEAEGRPFTVEPGGGVTLEFTIKTPARVGTVAFRVTARAGDLSDGELRPLPVLPGRMHLSQSRFATLRDRDRRELTFEDLGDGDDPTRIDEQLVVTLDAQLFYSVLRALPYLIDYPYECTEQTLNRFLSTGIVGSVFESYPAVARMAERLAERETRFERFDDPDPNRKMTLEETPWLALARGGGGGDEDLINVLDPRIVSAERDSALAKLEQAQLPDGGFPWWSGGPPSPYMTLYLVYGFSKALEFDVDVPREMVVKAWSYLHQHYEREIRDLIEDESHYELVTFLNYVLSNYPDTSWTGELFDPSDRQRMLERSFRNWRGHSPLLKGYLAMTLERAGRSEDAVNVWESVMDSARTTRDEGTFWAPEDRSWLWYNDTIESHAFALRALTELDADDERRHGLVQWLLLNKKLNHWKSTRATAEVVYSLVHYLRQEDQLGAREAVTVKVGPRETELVFEPDEYTGRRNQIVISGDDIDPETMTTTVVEKETPGFLFASATWHFSTERLPEEASGDLFAVTRQLFRRVSRAGEWVLEPLAPGDRLETGAQVEVHLVIRARHAAEYVHLRDPRAAGFEPESLTSGYRWNLGIGYFEEVRDSGTNFFFDALPVGEFTLKYRLRAATSGVFKVAPATLQSMYAPEFTGYSAGDTVSVGD